MSNTVYLDSLRVFKTLSVDEARLAFRFVQMCMLNKEYCSIELERKSNCITPTISNMRNLTHKEFSVYLSSNLDGDFIDGSVLFYDLLELEYYNYATGQYDMSVKAAIPLLDHVQYKRLTHKAKMSVDQTIKVLKPTGLGVAIYLSLRQDGLYEIKDIIAEQEDSQEENTIKDSAFMPSDQLAQLLGS